LRVFAGVRQKVPNLTLVKVGGEFTAEQRNTISSLGLDDSIVVTSFLPPASLSRVYRRASALLQPSDAEGFGLPVIEAMACGCPVVASDLPVLREVGGPAAVFCRVGDIDSWKAGVANLLMDRSQGNERWTLRLQAILEWARNFTWVETARRTADIYRSVLKGRG
jgi:glycosyltransferase involved in cell wall biosynthesis